MRPVGSTRRWAASRSRGQPRPFRPVSRSTFSCGPSRWRFPPGDAAEITAVEYYGHDVRYELVLADGTTLSARTHPDVLYQRGDRVAIAFDASSSTAFVD